jgi:hypothetical protein
MEETSAISVFESSPAETRRLASTRREKRGIAVTGGEPKEIRSEWGGPG